MAYLSVSQLGRNVSDTYPQKMPRKQAASYLASLGYPIAPRTLERLACSGRGPPYQRFGSRTTSYDKDEVRTWAEARSMRIEGEKKPR